MLADEMTIQFRVKELIAAKERREGRRLPYRTIYDECGVSTNTLSQMVNQKTKMIGVVTIDKLCQYFDCEPGDLIVYIE